jgi:HEAT repeat protein
VLFQDDTSAIIDRLGGDDPAARESAERDLKALGPAARDALRKAERHADPEVRSRAYRLLRVLETRAQLTPNLLKTVSGIDERLALDRGGEWCRVLLELVRRDPQARRSFPGVEPQDLGAIITGLLERTETTEHKVAALDVLADYPMESFGPAVLRLCEDRSAAVRRKAAWLAGLLRVRDGVQVLGRLLEDADSGVRARSAVSLGMLQARAFVPAIRRMLDDPDSEVCCGAARALGILGDQGSAHRLIELLTDRRFGVPLMAGVALKRLDPGDQIRSLLSLVEQGGIGRTLACGVLAETGNEKAVRVITRLLEDPDELTQVDASWHLCLLGSRKGAPRVLKQGRQLYCMNGLREPDLTRRLLGLPMGLRSVGSRTEVLAVLAREAGLKLDLPNGFSDVDSPVVRLDPDYTIWSSLALSCGTEWEFILHPDRIEITNREDALKIWTTWWDRNP